eukprot:scaffold2602_cov292-Prasinococcus_capsulatus_cf.AAC.3
MLRCAGRGVAVRAEAGGCAAAVRSIAGIHAGAALHCWPTPSLAVAEISRVLKPGATVVVRTCVRACGRGRPSKRTDEADDDDDDVDARRRRRPSWRPRSTSRASRSRCARRRSSSCSRRSSRACRCPSPTAPAASGAPRKDDDDNDDDARRALRAGGCCGGWRSRYWFEDELESLFTMCGLVDYKADIRSNYIMLSAKKPLG